MDLTPRQQLFLDKLFDLYRESDGPVHYSAVAERLGVNKFSAYDMLKLLEEKGVVASTYVLKEDNAGPGRSLVLFYPTREAIQYITQLKYEVFSLDEWYQFKESLLQNLRQTQNSGYGKAARDILAHLPDVKTPLAYCTQMVGVLLLNVAQVTRKADQMTIYRLLKSLVADGEIGLGALAGFSLGSLLSSQSEDDSSLADKLVSNTRQFQDLLSQMSEESIRRLNSFLKDALKVFERAA